MCPNCGDEVDAGEVCGPWDCVYCGETMVPKDKTDVTPNEELKDLANDWRMRSAKADDAGQSDGLLKAAKELTEVMNDGK